MKFNIKSLNKNLPNKMKVYTPLTNKLKKK